MVKTGLSIIVLAGLASTGLAQEEKAAKESRLQIGGYGEAVMTRNFFSQSFNRYNAPERYNNDDSHDASTCLMSHSIWAMTSATAGH